MGLIRPGQYANVTATLALVVALGGTSYAAIELPANSVGSREIKRDAVRNLEIAAGAVTSLKVQNGSLLTSDFKSGQLPAGKSYTQSASDDRYLRRTSTWTKSATVPIGTFSGARADCPPGEQAIGGGVDNRRALVTSSGPIINGKRSLEATDGGHPAATGWWGTAVNTNNSDTPERFVVSVICSPVG